MVNSRLRSDKDKMSLEHLIMLEMRGRRKGEREGENKPLGHATRTQEPE